MYGLVQAARQWWRKLISILVEEFKFKKSQADACVLTREDEYGVIILCIYVDDALMVGDHAAIEKTVAQLKTKVSLERCWTTFRICWLHNGERSSQTKCGCGNRI
jgi:Reverse transcriptase (RNA-dependent DNA polymerase)